MKGLKQYIFETEEKSKDEEKKKPIQPQKDKPDWTDVLNNEMKKVQAFINGDALEEFIKDNDLDGDYGKQLKDFLFLAKKIIKSWAEELKDPEKFGIEMPKTMQEFYNETLKKLAGQISDEIGGDPAANQEFMRMLYSTIWRRATDHSLSDRCEKENNKNK